MLDRIALKQFLLDENKHLDSLKEVLNYEKTKESISSLEKASSDASFWQDTLKAKETIQKLNDLKWKLDTFNNLGKMIEELDILLEISKEDESSLTEADDLIKNYQDIIYDFENKLILSDELDKNNCILEIHSGAGGTESLDWCSMLYRMYQMYASKHKYSIEVLEYLEGDEAGIKSVSIKVSGLYAYGMLKGESGVHRLIRLSPFDSDHARHTTFASVLVTPLIEDDLNVEIKDEDIRVDVFHSSGAGGQSVNTTDSAVRITHIPTKIVVTCQNERSQIQNKETCLKILKSKIYQMELEKRKSKIDNLRNKSQIAFGSQIRTYTFHPYSLVKDHRTQTETSQVQKVMDGDLDIFISSYLRKKEINNA